MDELKVGMRIMEEILLAEGPVSVRDLFREVNKSCPIRPDEIRRFLALIDKMAEFKWIIIMDTSKSETIKLAETFLIPGLILGLVEQYNDRMKELKHNIDLVLAEKGLDNKTVDEIIKTIKQEENKNDRN